MRQSLTLVVALVVAVLVCGSVSAQVQRFNGEERNRSPFWSGECSDGLVADDGTVETAYGWTTDIFGGMYMQKFTPSGYPFQFIKVCVCWVQNGGDTELDFELVVFDDDGPDGGPNTLLARIPYTAQDIPNFLPGEFYTVPLAGFVPNLKEGSVYIGANWNPSVERGFFICADQSSTTPRQTGFRKVNFGFPDERPFVDILESFAGFRSMLIRPEGHGGRRP